MHGSFRVRAAARRRFVAGCGAALAAALAVWCGPAPGQSPPAVARARLLLQVRDRPPAGAPSFHVGSDNSYTVSTGGTGETQDERAVGAPDNASTVSTGNSLRQLIVFEGERVRVDLPAVQSLQFHVPAAARSAPSATAPGGAVAASTAQANRGRSGANAPSVAGVVYYDAVAAFDARFAVRGTMVSIELVPLRSGAVEAPMIGATGLRALLLQGRVGEWIALGDSEVASGGRGLAPTAEPPSPASLWVRVLPAPAAAQSAEP